MTHRHYCFFTTATLLMHTVWYRDSRTYEYVWMHMRHVSFFTTALLLLLLLLCILCGTVAGDRRSKFTCVCVWVWASESESPSLLLLLLLCAIVTGDHLILREMGGYYITTHYYHLTTTSCLLHANYYITTAVLLLYYYFTMYLYSCSLAIGGCLVNGEAECKLMAFRIFRYMQVLLLYCFFTTVLLLLYYYLPARKWPFSIYM